MTDDVMSLSSYAEDLEAQGTPTLGSLVWYAVSSTTQVEYDSFAESLKDAGLEKYTPKRPKDLDIFRRACTNAETKKVEHNGQIENWLVRNVEVSAGNHWKQIVVEQVDGQNRRLSYEPVLEIRYNPEGPAIVEDNGDGPQLMVVPGGRITHEWIGGWHPGVHGAYMQILRDFAYWRGNLHDYVLREMIRDVIVDCKATVVRPSGGVYFVMAENIEAVNSLESIVDSIAGASIHTVPLVDNAKQREMLRQAVQDETVGETTRMIKEIDELLDGPPITEKRFIALSQKRKELSDKVTSYIEMLDAIDADALLRLQSLDLKIASLFNHRK